MEISQEKLDILSDCIDDRDGQYLLDFTGFDSGHGEWSINVLVQPIPVGPWLPFKPVP